MNLLLHPQLLLTMPGGSEWVLIILVVLLFFGGKKIPELMRGIGRGVREFNDAKETVKNEIDAGMREKETRVKENGVEETRVEKKYVQQPTENLEAIEKTK